MPPGPPTLGRWDFATTSRLRLGHQGAALADRARDRRAVRRRLPARGRRAAAAGPRARSGRGRGGDGDSTGGLGCSCVARGDGGDGRDNLSCSTSASGVTILVLATVRLAWRLSGRPARVGTGSERRRAQARGAAWRRLLYLLLFLIPISGLALFFGSGEDWDIGGGEWQAPFEIAERRHYARRCTSRTHIAFFVVVGAAHRPGPQAHADRPRPTSSAACLSTTRLRPRRPRLRVMGYAGMPDTCLFCRIVGRLPSRRTSSTSPPTSSASSTPGRCSRDTSSLVPREHVDTLLELPDELMVPLLAAARCDRRGASARRSAHRALSWR